MESVLRKLGGHPIKPAALYKELETGCLRAVPDNEAAADFFLDFFSKSDEWRSTKGEETREKFEEYYQWHLSGSVWEKYFDETDPVTFDMGWGSKPRIHTPQEKLNLEEQNYKHSDLSKWLIANVLGEPEKINSYLSSRMTRDLIYKSATSSTGGMYFNESSAAFDGQQHRSPFDFNIAYDQMKSMCERRNYWENIRIQRIEALSKENN
jgi:hypothetical protein